MRLVSKFSAVVSAATLAAIGVIVPMAAQAAPSLPSGFVLETRTTPFTSPTGYKLTDISYVPGGTNVQAGTFAAGKDGRIAWLPDSGGSGSVIGTIPNVRNEGDNGFTAIRPANDYATSNRVYVLYVQKNTPHHYGMLESWKVNSAVNPTSIAFEKKVIDGKAENWIDDGPNHQVGDVLVWPDGTLFVSQGDGGDPNQVAVSAFAAQDLTVPHGKILHVNADGTAVSNNPFYSASAPKAWKSRIYAYGVRNGFRLWRDPNTGKLASAIVGLDTTEEVANVQAGGNYGWPCWEGTEKTPGYSSLPQCAPIFANVKLTQPLLTYPHNGMQASVTGGVVYTGSSYPSTYKNKTFVGDYARKTVSTYATDGTKLTAPLTLFGSAVGASTAVRVCQGGDICWTDIANGNIIRLRYAIGNHFPDAEFTTAVDYKTKTVTVDGSTSYDPDGDPITFNWDFGDGAKATGVTAKHTYTGSGPYDITLIAVDTLGNSDEITKQVYPTNSAPTVQLTLPATKDFAVGDTVALSAKATDVQDGALDANKIKWTAQLKHCPFNGDCHIHPLTESTGASFKTTFPDHGGDTGILVTATSPADSVGATGSVSFTAAPRLRNISVVAPTGAQVTIGSENSRQTKVVVNSATLLAVSPSFGYQIFNHWDDGVKSATRTITMPSTDKTYTATYDTYINQRYVALGGAKSTLGTPTAEEKGVGSGRVRTYKWGSLYWSSSAGAHYAKGTILWKFGQMGGPVALGFPTTDEVKTSDGKGAFNKFSKGGAIYWSSASGAHEIHGGIGKQWLSLGAEKSKLGYPTGEEKDISIGRQQNFQHGYITWDKKTGLTKVYYS